MMNYKILTIGTFLSVAGSLVLPCAAVAYFSPEDVLLSREFFLPPSNRETDRRIDNQVSRSAEFREREHALLEKQVPNFDELENSDLLVDVPSETLRAAAPEVVSGGLDDGDIKLLQALRLLERQDEIANKREQRLLERVTVNQQLTALYGQNPDLLRSGAPNLAPTGPGGVMAALVMVGAIAWTIRRAKKVEEMTRLSL